MISHYSLTFAFYIIICNITLLSYGESSFAATVTNTAASNTPKHQAQCLTIPNQSITFNDISPQHWEKWITPLNLVYSQNEHLLAVTSTPNDRTYLRQKMAPSSRGSERVLLKAKLPSDQTYTLTQSIFIEPEFDWGNKNEGGKLGFGLAGGSSPSGGEKKLDGFTIRLMWRGSHDGHAKLVLYAYKSDQEKSAQYGEDIPFSTSSIPINQWFTVTMQVTMNSNKNAHDGMLKAWLDGELLVDKQEVQWQQTDSPPAISYLLYSTFHGGNDASWSPSNTSYLRFSGVCWNSGPRETP